LTSPGVIGGKTPEESEPGNFELPCDPEAHSECGRVPQRPFHMADVCTDDGEPELRLGP